MRTPIKIRMARLRKSEINAIASGKSISRSRWAQRIEALNKKLTPYLVLKALIMRVIIFNYNL